MGFLAGETGVIVPVPAAEALVGAWRRRYDTSAPLGVPPHVTVCYPFVPWAELSADDVRALGDIVAGQRAFEVSFPRTATFPGVLYLEPDPDEPFRALTAALLLRWPDHPPYGGAFEDPVPHLTVTETADPATMTAIDRDLSAALPLATVVDGAALLRFDGVAWRIARNLPFATDPSLSRRKRPPTE